MVQRLDQLTQFLTRIPRIWRMLIVAFFALMVALAVSPLVDHIYLRYFFTVETVLVPSLVTVAIASLAYIGGWLIYVGTVKTKPSAQKRILWYFVFGIVVTLIVIVLLIQGVHILSFPVGSS